jgi:hypothetical protein
VWLVAARTHCYPPVHHVCAAAAAAHKNIAWIAPATLIGKEAISSRRKDPQMATIRPYWPASGDFRALRSRMPCTPRDPSHLRLCSPSLPCALQTILQPLPAEGREILIGAPALRLAALLCVQSMFATVCGVKLCQRKDRDMLIVCNPRCFEHALD